MKRRAVRVGMVVDDVENEVNVMEEEDEVEEESEKKRWMRSAEGANEVEDVDDSRRKEERLSG